MPGPGEQKPRDTNSLVASLLRDMAKVQASTQSKWGYRRAADAIRDLDRPIEEMLLPDGTLRKIKHVGPSSTRIIMEVLQQGTSPTVAQAIAGSPRETEVEESRELRGNFLSQAEVVKALRNRRLTGPRLEDYSGDLQMHSRWSDGVDTLAAIADGCLARGYRYCAVTDHSYGLPVAGGMSMAEVEEQHREIDALNAQLAGRFRMLKGIEANIRADGAVDMTADELARFEVVVGSPHSALRSRQDQTARMVTAVSSGSIHILGHPRGRMYGSRPGVQADWDRVFRTAARTGVAIEIDGDPSRQDVDFELAARAVAAGCFIAVDSDAHSVEQLRFAEIGLAHARLAGVPAERVINTWAVEQLLEWAALVRRG